MAAPRQWLFVAAGLLFVVALYWGSTLSMPASLAAISVEAVFFPVLVGLFLVGRRLRDPLFAVGMGLIALGLLIDVVDDFAGETALTAAFESAFEILGAAAVLPGIYLIQRRRQREIEELRTVSQLLRESEERYRRLADNASDILFRVRLQPELTIDYVSPAIHAITGMRPDEVYADPGKLRALLRPEDADRALAAVRSPALAKAPLNLRLWRDGEPVQLEIRMVPVADESGRITAVEGIARDVTESRQLEEQLRRAQRLETAGRIAGQVAHDFNNLLGPLVGYPELIMEKLAPDHPARALCQAMLRSAEHMASINQNLLTLGRRGLFDPLPTDLNGVVRQAIESLGKPPATLRLELSLADDLMPVAGAPSQLLRVVSNLLTNAREAMADDGAISVRTSNVYVDRPLGRYNRVEIGEYVRVDVADTGPGIDPAVRERIFDAFFTTKQDRPRGAGLGLSVVQAIVDDHRGYVDVQCDVGRGTTFSVFIPVTREALVEPTAEDMPGGTERILIVDDDPIQREVAQRLLERLGYQTVVTASGEEALELLGREPVDLMVLDMVMAPGIDGAETYRRSQKVQPGVRAIVVSGFAESERVQEARRRGAGAYVRKPVTLATLARAVRQELDRPAPELAARRAMATQRVS